METNPHPSLTIAQAAALLADHEHAAHWAQSLNIFGGYDFRRLTGGQTLRLADDDGHVTLHSFTDGAAMLLAGSITFTGNLANPQQIARTLGGLL